MPTGLITRNGQTVYVDRRNNKFYVLQGITERINQQAQKTVDVLSKNLTQISDIANITNNFVQSVGAVGASFNRDYIKQEFATNLVNVANDTSNLTNQTRQQVINDRNNPAVNQQAVTQPNATDFNISFEQKTITTTVVRQNPAKALSDVAAENRRHALENGFETALTVQSTGPSTVTINGQRWYKSTATITYEKIDSTVLGPERRRLFEQRIQNQVSTAPVQPTSSPVLSVPANITPTIPTVTPVAALFQPTETLPNVPYPGGIYQRNSRGNNVKLIQERLNRVLRSATPLVEDGIFGTLTFNAVTQFQQNWNSTNTNKLIVDGRVGNNTWNALFSTPVQSTLAPVVIQQQSITTLGAPSNLTQPITIPTGAGSTSSVVGETNTSTNLFTRTSATATPRTPPPTRPRTAAPAPTPPIATPGFDIDQSQSIFGTPRKLSIFEIEALNNRLASPFISDEEKVRIRQILGVANELPADLKLPQDPQLEFSQEVTRPNLSVTTSGNTAKLSFNSGRAVNIEYSIDNGTTYTVLNPPLRAGDITVRDLEVGIYAIRIRGIRSDGTKTAPSQPQAAIIKVSQPIIRRTEPESATSAIVIFDDSVTPNDIKNYQFTTRSDNAGWTNALPTSGKGEAIRSPILIFGLEVDRTYTIRIRAVYKDGSVGNVSNSATLNTFKTKREGGGVIA
jgi:hypothetical protein